jgi:GDP/UDP-N,N'-diacetylbacillosamine 2-epimerase (hydrolysing)
MPDVKRRIVYLSGTRADFGLMRRTLLATAAQGVSVEVAVTGTHLSAEHGYTVSEIRASGLRVCAEIVTDVHTRTAASMSLAIAQTLDSVTRLLAAAPPDALLLLGDRGEMLAGAIAALHTGIPAVHVHGGERSGTVDEPVRHAISKMATYHFVATETSRVRLERMGERTDRIFVTGAPGIDGLVDDGAMARDECLRKLGLPVGVRFLLVVFHPVVQQASSAREQTLAVAQAVSASGLPVVWMEPNADAGALGILDALDATHLPPGSVRHAHLSREVFAAAMNHCDVMLGNSSAGIIEAATFGTPVVNIGDRQRLREHGPNVIDVPAQQTAIEKALRAQLAHGRWPRHNPWGDGHTAPRIAQLLQTLPLHSGLLEKINNY